LGKTLDGGKGVAKFFWRLGRGNSKAAPVTEIMILNQIEIIY
jgi:hypothetical protein